MDKSRLKLFVAIIISFLLGLAVSHLINFFPKKISQISFSDKVNGHNEIHLGPNNFVNPLIDCGTDLFNESPKAAPIEEAVEEYVASVHSKGEVDIVGVYYRDLIDGPQFGINEKTLFVPASLLKVPVLVGYMKYVEKNPKLLEQEIIYNTAGVAHRDATQVIQPPDPLVPGQKYTINQLLTRMITKSDNLATEFLCNLGFAANGSAGVNKFDGAQILKDMGVKTVQSGDDFELTVAGYASIFRILYNSTYLMPAYSNASLELLTKTEMKDGLRKGVPENIQVAHKFGERTLADSSQFHDCGIIYHPTKPYLLCVMTRGKEMPKLIHIISEISRIVYGRVDSINMNKGQ